MLFVNNAYDKNTNKRYKNETPILQKRLRKMTQQQNDESDIIISCFVIKLFVPIIGVIVVCIASIIIVCKCVINGCCCGCCCSIHLCKTDKFGGIR